MAPCKQVDVADNVDLLRVIQEFEDSYEIKYGRKPKLVRSVQGGGCGPPPHEVCTQTGMAY